jgi:hypothetical protein
MFTILWDNDGVLVDTEALYFRATQTVLQEVGITLEIDGSSRLSGKSPVTGRVHYEVTQTLMAPPIANLAFDLIGHCSASTYCYPGVPVASGSGVMEVSFPPIESALLGKPVAPFRTTSAAFFRFVSIPNSASPSVQIPISNALGVLLDIYCDS